MAAPAVCPADAALQRPDFQDFLSLGTEQRLFELDKALRNRIYRPGTALHRLFRKRFDAVEQPAFVLWDGLLLLYRLL